MAQRRCGLDLHHEALGAEHGGQFRLQHLDRDLAVVLQVLGEVHRGHAAGAELALDAVAVGESDRQAGKVGHGGQTWGWCFAPTSVRTSPPRTLSCRTTPTRHLPLRTFPQEERHHE